MLESILSLDVYNLVLVCVGIVVIGVIAMLAAFVIGRVIGRILIWAVVGITSKANKS